MDFTPFKLAIARQFECMQAYPLFRVAVEKDALVETYQRSFPEGTNRVFRKRAEHDCACCNQFIRTVGDVVAVIDGEVVSVWDITGHGGVDDGYRVVAAAMSNLVKSCAIREPFLHYARTAGTDKNFEQMFDGPHAWSHFFVNVKPQFVAPQASIPTTLGEQRQTYDVFKRSLTEIDLDAIDTVLDLIKQGSLYKGEEHLHAIEGFRKLKVEFAALPITVDNATFCWANFNSAPLYVTRIRGTLIGTLLVDLSKGKELEHAVAAYEAKAAPTNYKRSSALVTQGMINKAKVKIEELGLTSALDRRYANGNDVTVRDVLFIDRASRTADVFGDITPTASEAKEFTKVQEMPIDKFLADVLPRATGIEVMFENAHVPNLVSLIAPVDPTAGDLFKWGNNFSWSYNGEVTDSIKERVKQAGGNVTGELCCRLAWNNKDDLDLHMFEPGGEEIYFNNRHSRCGGRLDVDANGQNGMRDNPVENIFYLSRATMREGEYRLVVSQWAVRETTNIGFEAEIDDLGTVHRFAYPKAMRQDENVEIARFKFTRAHGIEIIKSLPSTQAVRTVWGVPTQTFNRVKMITLSPNYWGSNAVGHKHYFFMLDSCVNDGTVRGFYNEFLRQGLNPHRKVFEVVGSKMKPAPTPNQLSGLGFSSTQRNTLLCRVKGSFSRLVRIVF